MPPWWLLGIGFTHVQILSQYAGSGLFHGMAGLPVSTDVAWFVGMGANILVLLACGAVFRGPPRSFEKAAGSVDHSQHRRVSALCMADRGHGE